MSDSTGSSIENIKSILYILAFCWISYFLSLVTSINQYGIHPRSLDGLVGIILSPFLHGSIGHLLANSSGLLLFGWVLGVLERKKFFEIMISLILLGGGATWLFARKANHIGASGLIFGLFGYLLFIGYFQKRPKFILISLMTLFGYGGMIFGVLPGHLGVSWESHLFGFLAGIAIARWKSKSLED